MRQITLFFLIVILLFSFACQTQRGHMIDLNIQLKKLAPFELSVHLEKLPESEQKTLKLLVEASQIIDRLFLQQVSQDNLQMLQELQQAASTDREKQLALDYFNIMFGPWDRLDEDRPFIGQKEKPPGAAYYPEDMTQKTFNQWIENHPEDKEAFESNFTVIRKIDPEFQAIPYSQFYGTDIQNLANLLDKAAETTQDKTLKTFLKSRAHGLRTDDYYQSDMDWMDLTGDLEIVIGPYEVYEDKLFGYKAAFESFICVVDHDASDKQKEIGNYLDEMESHLPIDDKYKNFDRGASSPIKVVDLAFSSGDTKAGIQTTAFNLPNDERVRQAKGSKKVMLKNVMRAKFDKCWIPIVNTVLSETDLKQVSFDGYFYHVLLHEVSHGLGPGIIKINGRETTVNKALKEHYSTIEECKADVLSVYMTQFLIDKGVLPKDLEKTLYSSNLGGMFRSIRFGIDEAHGGGVAIQLNYYVDKGAVTVNSEGKYTVNPEKIREAVKSLAHEVLTIEANGDYEAAANFIDSYRYLSVDTKNALNALKNVPIDIRPIYLIEGVL